MHFVDYDCPNCRTVTPAPMGVIVAGDLGIWQCEQCNAAYSIRIDFRRISPDLLKQRRDELQAVDQALEAPNDEAEEAERGEFLQRRLIGLRQEITRLHSGIDDLEQEARRLEEEIEQA